MALIARTVLQCARKVAKMRPMKAWEVGAVAVLVMAGEARADGPVAQPFPGVPLGPVAPAPSSPPPPPVEPPPSGLAFIVSGALLSAAGVGNLATAPLCKLSMIRADVQGQCIGVSVAFGGAFLAAGIPLLVVGVGKRNAWLAAKRVGLAPMPGGMALTGTW